MSARRDEAAPRVRDGLAAYHRANGFDGDAMYASSLQVHALGRRFDVPNPKFQRRLIAIHDVHHVLTGFGTDLRGEAEMGAWELGAGPGHWFVWLNNLGALALGALCPRRTWRAFRWGRRCRSLYRRAGLDYQALLDAPIAEARARLRIDDGAG